MYIYIVNSIIIFSTLSTKKEDLVCSVGCNELVKSSSPQDRVIGKKSLCSFPSEGHSLALQNLTDS